MKEFFPLAPASESIVLFLDNPSVFLYLIQPDLFNWICFPLCIGCWKYWSPICVLPVENTCDFLAQMLYVYLIPSFSYPYLYFFNSNFLIYYL